MLKYTKNLENFEVLGAPSLFFFVMFWLRNEISV